MSLIKQLNRHCGSMASIMVSEGSLSLDSRPFGSWKRDIHPARKAQACSTLQAAQETFPAAPLQSPEFCESPRIPKVPAATKPADFGEPLHRERSLQQGSIWEFLRTQPYGVCLACFVKYVPLSLWQAPIPRG